MKTLCESLGAAWSNIAARATGTHATYPEIKDRVFSMKELH